jgi:hypothetical protein
MPHLGKARQMITAKITFRKSNKNSLEHHAGAFRSRMKKISLDMHRGISELNSVLMLLSL